MLESDRPLYRGHEAKAQGPGRLTYLFERDEDGSKRQRPTGMN